MRRGTLVSDLMRDMEISGFFHSFPRPSSTGHLQFLLIFFLRFPPSWLSSSVPLSEFAFLNRPLFSSAPIANEHLARWF